MGHHSPGPLLSTSASAISSRKLITGGSRVAPQARPCDLVDVGFADVCWADTGRAPCETIRLPGYVAEIIVAFRMLILPLTVESVMPFVRRVRSRR